MAYKLLLAEKSTSKYGSKQLYPDKTLIETTTNGFFTVDKDWLVQYWNKAAEGILNVKAKDIVGKNLRGELRNIIPFEFHRIYQKAFVRDMPLHFEEYWGKMGAWSDVITYFCDDVLSVSFKSSEQPQNVRPETVVKQLEALTELYKFVTEITNDSLWDWDLRTNEIFWIDGGYKRMFGYLLENALIPQSFWESRIHPEDKQAVIGKIKEALACETESVWEVEYRFKKTDGSYAYVHDRGQIICEDGHAIRIIGATQNISEKVQSEKNMEGQVLANQRAITSAVLVAQEKERMEIGRELHDNLNQVLAITKIYIQLAQKNEENQQMYLDKSIGFVSDVMEEIRRISKTLVLTDIEVIGLAESIKVLLDDFKVINPIKIDFEAEGVDLKAIDEKLQINIFRIIQEQLNNILKHAKATFIDIKISTRKKEMILFISDNGIGCDVAQKSNGVGIRNIMSRVELYHGKVTIVSKPGKGYALNVVFPVV